MISLSLNCLIYFRIYICIETSHGVSNGTIVKQRNVGPALFAQGDVAIPISGYIIGWQYYLINIGSHLQCSDSSYVSVWGRRGSDSYGQVAATLLQPEDLSEGVRFQIVQRELIRVEKGDILAIFTNGCGNPYKKNLVSAQGFESDDFPKNGFWQSSSPNNFPPEYLGSFDARQIFLSLHAYVTGEFVSLISCYCSAG